ncbi:hypothetical protein ACN47E_002070 [Coniothyrium glycines]
MLPAHPPNDSSDPSEIPEETCAQVHSRNHNTPSLDDLVHTFLHNAMLRFGEQSLEVTTINSILSTFQKSEISKRDALASITLTLRNHKDLKQDLMNVLFHRDARWGASDFDFMEPMPQFLQPVHQPQFRLPPPIPWISPSNHINVASNIGDRTVLDSTWHQHPKNSSLFSPEEWRSYKQLPLSSPLFSSSSQHTFPGGTTIEPKHVLSGKRAAQADDTNVLHFGWRHEQMLMPNHNNSELYRCHDGPSIAPTLLIKTTDSDVTKHLPLLAPKIQRSGSIDQSPEVYTLPSPSVLGTPFAVPIGCASIDMAPPAAKRRHHEQVFEASMTRYEDAAETEGTTSKVIRTAQGKGESLFIHSLCGKAFVSRSKLRKHHWGAKVGDLNTKTGCWARHNKPNINWDDHSSCKDGQSNSRNIDNTQRHISTQRAPEVPCMFPSPKSSGFPTLEYLPQTVAETLASGSQYMWNPLTSSTSYQTPSRNSFDSLLSAVDVASWIDAPKPDGRLDPLVSHCDNQAVVADCDRPHGDSALGQHSTTQIPGSGDMQRTRSTVTGLGINISSDDFQEPRDAVLFSPVDQGR